ncbi:hypothetical protein Lalb_Chr13g0290321 [Lupinus albus]|uniref:Uncharacterized protein n=1 Tax=Lupinus albus TaxID=3870 RepID=A0A6A4PH37_LUPAL|nr:hypothetical protein Lalb_Chr13g0290321 [Lupinus albus]
MDCVDVCEKENGIIECVEVNNDVSTHKNLPTESEPITPDTVRENCDLHSPLTLINTVSENGDLHSPLTPNDAIFDPFAPVPHVNNPSPPTHTTSLHQLCLTVSRHLHFHPDASSIHCHNNHHHDYAESQLSDEDMFESVYQNLLQVILSKQTEEEILSQAPLSNVVEEYDSDDCKTPPPSSFLLLEELNTCPDAPIKVKPGAKRMNNFQLGLCKKLEF